MIVFSSVLALYIFSQITRRPLFKTQLGADFIAFYSAGIAYNEVSPAGIYDRDLTHKILLREMPDLPPEERYPYVNAPFFILPFPLLSRLPYVYAYLAWLLISITGFGAGLTLLWKTLDAIPRTEFRLVLLVSFSFMPLLVECLAGGQTTAFGFLAISAAIYLERKEKPLLSGMAVSLLAYKPTLLLLILPMLLFTRRYRALLGVVVGGVFLSALSILAVGKEGCESFIRMLFYFADHSAGTQSGLKSWKYVDINSFFRLLTGQHAYLRWALTATAYAAIFPVLLLTWLRTERGAELKDTLMWATTITWTLVANIYLGIYDSALVLLSGLLVVHTTFRLREKNSEVFSPILKLMLFMLHTVPWITQPVARLMGVQVFTLVLAGFGMYQISLQKRLAVR